MKNAFISLRPDPPDGFEFRTPTVCELLSSRVALLGDTLDAALSLLDDFPDRVCGVVITLGDTFRHSSIGPNLWHLVVTGDLLPDMHATASCLLDMMAHAQRVSEEGDGPRAKAPHRGEERRKTHESGNDEFGILGRRIEDLTRQIERRRHTEEVLRQSEENLRATLNSIGEAVITADIHGCVTHVNPAAENLTGWMPEEIQGKLLGEVFGNADAQRGELVVGPAIRALESGQIVELIEPSVLIGKDGTEHRVVNSAAPIRGADGTITGVVMVIRDVTEEHRIQSALQESEERFSLAMEASKDGLWDWDVRTGEVHRSPGYSAMLGHSPDEIPAHISSLTNLVHPDDRDAVSAVNLDCIDNRRDDIEVEFRMRAKGGDWRWIQRRGKAVVRDDAGKAIRLIGIHTDITERKNKEAELAATKGLLETAIAQSPAGIVIADAPDVTIRLANSAAFGIRGGDQKILTGIDAAKHPTSWQLHRQDGSLYPGEQLPLSRAVLHGDVTQGEEIIIRDVEGNVHWVSTNAAPVRDANGKITAGIVVFYDITERKRAEEALRRSEEKYRTFFENSADAMLIIRGNSFIDCNDAAVAMLMHESRDDLLNMHPWDLSPEFQSDGRLSRDKATEIIEIARVKGSHRFEWDHIRKSGEVFPVEVSLTALPAGEETLLHTIWRDISDRKRAERERLSLERQVQHAQKLESLGVLAGGIAHDFNNLLMTILGNVELTLENLSPLLPVRSNIQDIERAAKRAADLAKQMLAYSGKGKFVIESTDLNGLVDEMAHLLSVSISKKAQLKFHYANNLPAIDGDPTQIRQIIMNLITNASEAIGEDSGVITLSTGVMDCDRAHLDNLDEIMGARLDEPLSEGLYTYIEVADTGCGMDTPTRERIFDPFYTTKFTGRGLGMSAVLGILRGHRGAIQIHSEIGKGTTIRVLFPANGLACPSHRGQSRDTVQNGHWRGGGIVLVADDEETVCTVSRRMLEHMGFSVMTASDGRGALEMFRDHADEIVCVLLDLTMPHMDGEEAFREMQRHHPEVRVILCSGYDEQDAVQRFAGKGLAGFLQKPYSMTALRERLREVMVKEV